MAKLRKMLGDVNSQTCMDIMALIGTQSKRTIEKWAVEYAAENVLPVFAEACPGDESYAEIISACRNYNSGGMKLAELKPIIAEGRKISSAVKGDVRQAAARALATACATAVTPTNSFGFLMYAAAAKAYHKLGTDKPQAEYDAFAAEEMINALESLRAVSVENEPEPVKVNWNC